MNYLVSHQGEQIGSFTAAEIVAKIGARELDALDYAFDEGRRDWVLLTDLEDVAKLLRARKPAAPPPRAAAPAEPAWFIFKAENQFGPYVGDEVISLLQQKIVHPFDHAWHQGLGEWTRLSELAQFGPDAVRKRLGQNAAVFITRRHPRQPLDAKVVLHDTLNVWRGRAMTLSGGGIGVQMPRTARVTPGQTLNLHCAAENNLPAFNATCEVVAVNFGGGDEVLVCGLRFLSLSNDAQARINAKVA